MFEALNERKVTLKEYPYNKTKGNFNIQNRNIYKKYCKAEKN